MVAVVLVAALLVAAAGGGAELVAASGRVRAARAVRTRVRVHLVDVSYSLEGVAVWMGDVLELRDARVVQSAESSFELAGGVAWVDRRRVAWLERMGG